MYFSKMLLLDIIDYGIAQGASLEDLCKSIGVEYPTERNPQEQISYEQMVKALTIVSQAVDDDCLGLHLGEQAMLKGTQQVDNIMRSSPTIAEAFANATQFSSLISDALTSSLEKKEQQTKVSFAINPNWAVLEAQAVQQVIDMTLVCTLKSIYWLTGKKHAPAEVHLNYPATKKKKEYYRIFDCTVKFNEPVPAVIFHNPVLNQPVPSYNLGLLDFLKKMANEEIQQLTTEDPLINAIKQFILKNLPQKTNVNEVAAELLLSPRTLQRKLRELNTNFKSIEKNILLQLSKKLLLHEERNIEEISYLLGFSESSALIRFFKQGMGVSPKQYKLSN